MCKRLKMWKTQGGNRACLQELGNTCSCSVLFQLSSAASHKNFLLCRLSVKRGASTLQKRKMNEKWNWKARPSAFTTKLSYLNSNSSFFCLKWKLSGPDSWLNYLRRISVALLHNMKASDNYLALSQADSGIHISLAISNQPYQTG